jgi:hypothetical protein
MTIHEIFAELFVELGVLHEKTETLMDDTALNEFHDLIFEAYKMLCNNYGAKVMTPKQYEKMLNKIKQKNLL